MVHGQKNSTEQLDKKERKMETMESLGIIVAGIIVAGMCMAFGSIVALIVVSANELFCGGE